MNTIKTDNAGMYARGLVTRGYAVTGYTFFEGEVTGSLPDAGTIETDAPQDVFDAMVETYANRNK